jgi:hypothetical protein
MTIQFPDTPSQGDTFEASNGVTYTYDSGGWTANNPTGLTDLLDIYATQDYVDNLVANRGGANTVGAIAWMNTGRSGVGTGYNLTVSRLGNAEYQYTFVTPQLDNNYAVIGQTQEQNYETVRVRNKTVNGFIVTTAWVKTVDGNSELKYADNAHAVAVFSALSPN